MPGIPDAALTTIRAALEDADRFHEDHDASSRRVAQYLISSGYRITVDADDSQPTAA